LSNPLKRLEGYSPPTSKAWRATDKGEMSLWNLRTKYYKKYSLSYVKYLPQKNALDQKDNATANECWLRYKTKRIVSSFNHIITITLFITFKT
jgi:hypothetical protein